MPAAIDRTRAPKGRTPGDPCPVPAADRGHSAAPATSAIDPEGLAALDRAGLAWLWSHLMGGPVPRHMSQPIQRRFLAHALQARAAGDLAPALVARLDRVARDGTAAAPPGLKPGARLLRQWNGVTHVVDVEPEGFRWNGIRHRSLSAIARTITGARWSGPRFFGLTEKGDAPARSGTRCRRARSTELSSDPKRAEAATLPGLAPTSALGAA
ncbi:DUF2924 domain-containing protein [Tabrizicola sp. J26]|uniref:DUF2924 domain-containing protein n=1 Tax=Alitabrizicola rongguiensis TaxID=2909234 RepID=UPI001F161EA8|nr:DUF2924 domain-containing protein [Tabrizicola rongguiensis]MCF1710355.1 DUF2924 domain-containing protein [Tabrizicola rongguiensis]